MKKESNKNIKIDKNKLEQLKSYVQMGLWSEEKYNEVMANLFNKAGETPEAKDEILAQMDENTADKVKMLAEVNDLKIKNEELTNELIKVNKMLEQKVESNNNEEIIKAQNERDKYIEYANKLKETITKNKDAIEKWREEVNTKQKEDEKTIEQLEEEVKILKAGKDNNQNEVDNKELETLREKVMLSGQMFATAIKQLIIKDKLIKSIKDKPELLERIGDDMKIMDENEYRMFIAEKTAGE